MHLPEGWTFEAIPTDSQGNTWVVTANPSGHIFLVVGSSRDPFNSPKVRARYGAWFMAFPNPYIWHYFETVEEAVATMLARARLGLADDELRPERKEL